MIGKCQPRRSILHKFLTRVNYEHVSQSVVKDIISNIAALNSKETCIYLTVYSVYYVISVFHTPYKWQRLHSIQVKNSV